MNRKLFILALVFLPAFVHAQGQGQCPVVVVLPKELYESFRSAQGDLNSADGELKRDRESNGVLHKMYFGCEKQPDIADILKKADESLQAVEERQKKSEEAFGKVEVKVRQIILDAHRTPVVFRYFDQDSGQLGVVVTTSYAIQDDKVVATVTNDQLMGPVGH